MDLMREQKLALMKATHDDLANKWRMSLINNGSLTAMPSRMLSQQ